jgi:hypothetical protein
MEVGVYRSRGSRYRERYRRYERRGAARVPAIGSLIAGILTRDWRVKERIEYKPELRLRVYDDDWKWKEGEKYRWREAGPGRGYWRGGVWVSID